MNIFYKLIDEIQQIANSNGSHHIDTNVINQIFKCTKVVEIIREILILSLFICYCPAFFSLLSLQQQATGKMRHSAPLSILVYPFGNRH